MSGCTRVGWAVQWRMRTDTDWVTDLRTVRTHRTDAIAAWDEEEQVDSWQYARRRRRKLCRCVLVLVTEAG